MTSLSTLQESIRRNDASFLELQAAWRDLVPAAEWLESTLDGVGSASDEKFATIRDLMESTFQERDELDFENYSELNIEELRNFRDKMRFANAQLQIWVQPRIDHLSAYCAEHEKVGLERVENGNVPGLAEWLFAICYSGTSVDGALGCLEEQYRALAQAKGKPMAVVWYWSQVIRSMFFTVYDVISRLSLTGSQ